ncbi:MAG: diguanylate cyclase [Lachnospiraceae bacterium]|nr:diguanylate cyclase [Lachnospiraceae bacterium]
MNRHRILIVDDEKISLRMTNNILSSKYETVCASSGKEAIELIKESAPDLILSDLRMPEINGFELQEIVTTEIDKDIPFMFMTADKKDETESKGFLTGAVDYIKKPFRADVLLKRVENIFKNLEQIKGLKKAAGTDPMTGLLSKTSAQEEIGRVCKTTDGALLMIDLDNFKPINDIYGHAMGDKILIRFSEILCSAIRSTDIAGRMGGDEFVIFCKNIDDESIIQKKTEYISEELTKSAKEFMGEDMTIPVGVSIGCVFSSAEDRDFHSLFKKADKALYDIKRNGKHGFKIYKSDKEPDAGHTDRSFENAIMLLNERSPQKGALLLGMDQFKPVYQFISRVVTNYKNNIFVLLYTVTAKNGVETADAVEDFVGIARRTLRVSDVMTRYGKDQVIIIILNTTLSDMKYVSGRIQTNVNDSECCDNFDLTYEISQVGSTVFHDN